MIREGVVVDDEWAFVPAMVNDAANTWPSDQSICPLDYFLALSTTHRHCFGVWLEMKGARLAFSASGA